MHERIPSYLSDHLQRAWNRCWPPPVELAEFKVVGQQIAAARSCVVVAAPESPSAVALRERIRDGAFDDLAAIRTGNGYSQGRLERLGDREISVGGLDKNLFFYDDLGNKNCRDNPASKPARPNLMDLIETA